MPYGSYDLISRMGIGYLGAISLYDALWQAWLILVEQGKRSLESPAVKIVEGYIPSAHLVRLGQLTLVLGLAKVPQVRCFLLS